MSVAAEEHKKEPDQLALSSAYELLQSEPQKAFPVLEGLADKGSLMSMLYLADAYMKGLGTPTDLTAAEKWLMRATDRGSHVAPHQLGLLYLDLKDYEKAEKMFRLGASWNYLPSLYRLGMMYSDGVGVVPDPDQARDFFERASSMGHVFAKRRLAGMLLRGECGPLGVLRGLWLLIVGFAQAVSGAISDAGSERMRS